MKKNILLAGIISFFGFQVTAQNTNVSNSDLNASINQNADLSNYSTFSFTSDIKEKANAIKSSSKLTDATNSDNTGKAYGSEKHDGTYGDKMKDTKLSKKSDKMSKDKSETSMERSSSKDANLNEPKEGYQATDRSDNNTTAETGSLYAQGDQSSAMIADDEWKKVKQGVKYELTSRGYKMDKNNPDLVVSFQILKDDMEISNFANDNTTAGAAGTVNQTAEIQKGSLLITIAERKSGEVVWRGVSNRSLTENGSMEDENNVNMAVASVFDTFGFEANGSASSTR